MHIERPIPQITRLATAEAALTVARDQARCIMATLCTCDTSMRLRFDPRQPGCSEAPPTTMLRLARATAWAFRSSLAGSFSLRTSHRGQAATNAREWIEEEIEVRGGIVACALIKAHVRSILAEKSRTVRRSHLVLLRNILSRMNTGPMSSQKLEPGDCQSTDAIDLSEEDAVPRFCGRQLCHVADVRAAGNTC